MRRKILWLLFTAITAALLVTAPNALWLARSSALVRISGSEAMTLRIVIIDATNRFVAAGMLAPGASRFLWIDPAGEATLAVEVRDGTAWRRHCGEYVEAGMYRVEITTRTPDDVTCATGLPLLNRLLILDLMS